MLPCTPWAFIGARGVVGPVLDNASNKAGGIPHDLLNKQVIPELQRVLGGTRNLAVGWVDYTPSTFANVFVSHEVATAITRAERESRRDRSSTKNVLTTRVPEPEALPADLRDTVRDGISQAVAQLRDQAQLCPNQHFILAGYSEGAWVLGDALQDAQLKPYYDRIDEVLLFGDPKFDSASPAARRPTTLDQSGPRRALGVAARALGPRPHYLPPELESRAQSYCYGGPGQIDPICATPGSREGQQAPEPSKPVTNTEWARSMRTCRPILPGALVNAFLNCGHLMYSGGYATVYTGTELVSEASRNVTVSAAAPGWHPTGVSLKKGQQATIEYVSGDWTVNAPAAPEIVRVGPQGYAGIPAPENPDDPKCKVLLSAPQGALLGATGSSPTSVGPAAEPTWTGSLQDRTLRGAFTANADGQLFLRINDKDNCLHNNAGLITVKVRTVSH